MKREFLRGLGIEDPEVIKAIMDQNAAEIEIEKDKAEDIKNERDIAQTELKKFTDINVDKLTEDLSAANKKAEEIESNFNQYKKDIVLERALQKSGAHNPEDLTGFLDLTTLVFEENEVKGLDEQLNQVKESKPYLFISDEPKEKKDARFKTHTPPAGETPLPKEAASLHDALVEHYNEKGE